MGKKNFNPSWATEAPLIKLLSQLFFFSHYFHSVTVIFWHQYRLPCHQNALSQSYPLSNSLVLKEACSAKLTCIVHGMTLYRMPQVRHKQYTGITSMPKILIKTQAQDNQRSIAAQLVSAEFKTFSTDLGCGVIPNPIYSENVWNVVTTGTIISISPIISCLIPR